MKLENTVDVLIVGVKDHELVKSICCKKLQLHD